MKTFILFVLLLAILVCTPLSAQNDTAYLQRTCCNYLRGLQSDNEGIVEATLINLMKMISRYPDFANKRLPVLLDSLAISGETEEIRVMSRLIRSYSQHEIDLGWLAQHHFEEIDAFIRLFTSMERIVIYDR